MINYTVGSDATPICTGFRGICLKTGYQKWLSVVKESNEDKNSHFVSCPYFFKKEETSSMINPPDLPDCVAEISHGIENWLMKIM